MNLDRWLLVIDLVLLGAPWAAFFRYDRPPAAHPHMAILPVVVLVSVLVIAFVGTVAITRSGWPMEAIVGGLILSAGCLVCVFADLYYSIGTTRNFSMPLSHLDAIMVAVGTLSTAGTGDVAPKSELARGLLTTQMSLDVLFVGVVLALAVASLSRPAHRATE